MFYFSALLDPPGVDLANDKYAEIKHNFHLGSSVDMSKDNYFLRRRACRNEIQLIHNTKSKPTQTRIRKQFLIRVFSSDIIIQLIVEVEKIDILWNDTMANYTNIVWKTYV